MMLIASGSSFFALRDACRIPRGVDLRMFLQTGLNISIFRSQDDVTRKPVGAADEIHQLETRLIYEQRCSGDREMSSLSVRPISEPKHEIPRQSRMLSQDV